jgi:WD40 repeat protein
VTTQRALVVALLAFGCGSGPKPAAPESNERCGAKLLDEATSLRSDGYLNRALSRATSAAAECASPEAVELIAAVEADLGIDDAAPHTRAATDDERERALLLYRDGVNLRIDGEYEQALRQLDNSYAIAPHPLTIVQIGLVHRAAGDEVAARKAFARSLAVAELVENVAAEVVVPRGHADPVSDIVFTPDGRYVVSAAMDSTIRVWEVASGRVRRSMTMSSYLADLDMGSDGHLFVATYEAVIVYDTGTWAEVGRISVTDARAIAVGPNGRLIAVATGGGRLTIHDRETGDELRELVKARFEQIVSPQLRAVAFSSDGSILASGHHDGTVRLWDPATGDELRSIQAHTGEVTRIAVGHSGRLVSAGVKGIVKEWDPTTGDLMWSRNSQSAASGLSLSGSLTAVAGGRLSIFETVDGAVSPTDATFPSSRYLVATFSPDGTRLAAGAGGDVEVWDISEGGRVQNDKERLKLWDSHFTADTLFVAARTFSDSWVWRVGEDIDRISLGAADSGSFVVSPDGTRIVTGGSSVDVFELPGAESTTWQVAEGVVSARPRAWSRSGKVVGSVIRMQAGDSVIVVWDSRTGLRTFEVSLGRGVLVGSLSIDEAAARIAGRTTRRAYVWDVAEGTELWSRELVDGSMPGATISADGARAAFGDGTTARVHDAETGEVLAILTMDHGKVNSLALDSTGSRLVGSVFHRAAVYVFDVVTAERRELEVGAPVDWVEMSPDGSLIAVHTEQPAIELWDATTLQRVATIAVTADDVLIATPDGRVHGSADAHELLYWQVGAIQLPGFVGWQRQHEPALLRSLLR